MNRILSYGVYVPQNRLSHAELGAALGTRGGPGRRAVASHDQDTTCLGVEAARRAVRGAPAPSSVFFATTRPAYAERTNATAIHAALDLEPGGLALDLGAAVRSSFGALRAAATAPGPALAVLADQRGGRAGSPDEAGSGDAAAAFLFGDGDVDDAIAEVLTEASVTREFLDRWAAPGDPFPAVWEERFAAGLYGELVDAVATEVLTRAGLERADHVVVSSAHRRAAAAARKRFGDGAATWVDADVGYAGVADVGLRLAHALDTAAEGETILVVTAADGADAMLLRRRRGSGADDARDAPEPREISYTTFLTWRGMLPREQPRRPEPERPAAPPSARNVRWKYGFVGSRCEECGNVHLPPQRVCLRCHAVDRMVEQPMRDGTGRVSTFTIDRLAPSPDPPVVDVVVDFDGGGRFSCQLADAEASQVRIGSRVEMTFRRVFEAGGIHNYFWKARMIEDTEVAS